MATREFVLAIKADPSGAVREFQRLGDQGQAAMARLTAASQPASTGLQVMNVVAREFNVSMGQLADRAGVAGRVFSVLGSGGVAAAAGIALLSSAIITSVKAAAEAEARYLKIEAQLRATGNAAGYSAQSIVDMAEKIGRRTSSTGDEMEAAASVLLKFSEIAGNQFSRALELTADLAPILGSAESAAQALGRALQNPAEGMGALRRAGITLSDSQDKLIESLVKQGKTLEAQKLILDEVAKTVGGVGAATAGGLVGSFNQLTESVGEFFETAGQESGLLGAMAAGFNSMAEAVDKANDNIREQGVLLTYVSAFNNMIGAAPGSLARDYENDLRTDRDAQNRAAAAQQEIVDRKAKSDSVMHQAQEQINKIYADQQTKLEKQKEQAKKIAESANERLKSLAAEVKLGEVRSRGDEKALFVAEQLAKFPESAGKKQIDQARQLAEKIYDQNKAYESQKKTQDELAKQSEQAAKEYAELWNRPILRAAESLQDVFTGAFEKIFDGGVRSFGDLGKEIKAIFIKLAAEMAAAQFVQPIVSSLFSGLMATPGQFSGKSSGGLSGGNLLSLGGNLLPTGGLATGVINGLGLSGLTGSLGLTATGLVPGASATVAGPVLGATGLTTLGSIAIPVAGLALGALAGGLFGNKKPSNKSAGAFIDPNTGSLFQDPLGTISGVSTPKGTENLSRFNAVAQTITAALAQIKEWTGGSFGSGLFNVALGSRDPGFTVFNGQKTTFANDETLAFGAVKTALQSLTGISAEFKNAISGSTATNLNDLLAQVSLPKRRTDYNTSLSDELLQLQDPTAFALKQLDKEREARIKEAQEIGADIAAVERLYGEKRKQIVEQTGGNIYQQQKTLMDTLLGSSSALGGREKYDLARGSFESVAALALSGDSAARGAFGDIFNQFLSSSRDFNASSSAYKDDFSRAVSLYQQILGTNQLNLSAAGNSAVVESIVRQTAISQDNAKSLRDGIDYLTQQIKDLALRLARIDRPAGGFA